MRDNNYNWYPVSTRSRAEKKAYADLVRNGITAYLPLRKQLKQWSDRKKIIEEPLFKSYIFVYISEQQFPEVLKTNGISRFIYFSGKVAVMPDKQIEDLKLLLASTDDLELINYDIKPGELVVIKAGPFKGILAELVTINNQKNIVLRLKNLGYSINIKTSIAYIEPLK